MPPDFNDCAKIMTGNEDINRAVRRSLDRLYLLCGYFAACCLIIILIIVTAQMIARWTGEIIPGTADYAGYFMAASTFFAFAYALNNGSHIRVNMLLSALGRHRKWGELWCFVIASCLSAAWTYYAFKAVYWSYRLGDISQGLDATPLWIPQLAMAIGSAVFAVSMFDNLVRLLFFGTHSAHSRAIAGD